MRKAAEEVATVREKNGAFCVCGLKGGLLMGGCFCGSGDWVGEISIE